MKEVVQDREPEGRKLRTVPAAAEIVGRVVSERSVGIDLSGSAAWLNETLGRTRWLGTRSTIEERHAPPAVPRAQVASRVAVASDYLLARCVFVLEFSGFRRDRRLCLALLVGRLGA